MPVDIVGISIVVSARRLSANAVGIGIGIGLGTIVAGISRFRFGRIG